MLGQAVGANDGAAVGDHVGFVVGARDGRNVDAVGAYVGVEGLTLLMMDGAHDGSVDGDGVGTSVGTRVV